MKEQHLFENRMFSSIIDTQQSKDDVILDLPIIDFERF